MSSSKNLLSAWARYWFSVPGVLAGTAVLLLIPLLAMQFTDQVNWSASDFVLMGLVLAGTGMLMLGFRKQQNFLSRIAGGITIFTLFLLIWVNLAVGIVGSGPHWGNLLYTAVAAEIIAGSLISGFKSKGLMHTAFLASALLALIACVQLAAGLDQLPSASRMEIIGMNSFFAVLFFASGMLYRQALKM